MNQQEKPGATPEQLAATFQQDVSGVVCSGGQIENFRKGWAKHIMSGGKRAHYFRRDGFFDARSACGLIVDVRWIYGAGNWPKYKRCRSAASS